MTLDMMTDAAIDAAGVISVVSNVAPAAMTQLVALLADNQKAAAEKLCQDLGPLFGLVTVSTAEATPFGEVTARFRNPVGIKALLTILGMPSGGCRQPLGRMTRKGIDFVRATARKVQAANPAIFGPAAEFFNIDIDQRLNDDGLLEDLIYTDY